MKLDEDVAAAIDALRAKEDVGLSEALNRLARAGASVVGAGPRRLAFVQQTVDLGQMLDVSNVAEALEYAEASGDR